MSKTKCFGILLAAVLWLPVLGFAAAARSKVPTLNAISPSSAYAGGSSFTLTATGLNFTSGSVVQWNGSARTTTVVNNTMLQAQITAADIANVGSAKVTVYSPGRQGGTSGYLTFTINTAPTAPPPTTTAPPATTPLSITTPSVPGGTAGSAYTASMAASGGTPAYTWSTVSSGGALPPGLTLASTGGISGTPSTAGTYAFTAQAADSGTQIAQKVFSVAVAAAPAPPPPPPTTSGTTPLFQTGFESTDPSWDYVNAAPDVSINTNPAYVHSGASSLQIHYYICGDSTNVACGAAHQDINHWVAKNISPGLSHAFMRGYVYLKTPEPDATTSGQVVGKKLFWLADSANTNSGYQLVVSGVTGSGGAPTSYISLNTGVQSAVCGMSSSIIWDLAQLNFDTWYSIEVEYQLNTPGASDGVERVWVNGTKVLDQSNLNLRGNCSTPLTFFSVGRQADRPNWQVVDEYRYWDDVVVSDSFITP